MRIPDDVIDAVRAATDIVEVIGEALPLKKAGKRFKAACPFHTEKTPSFMVNPETQMFHCFGCGTGGNVFTFLMRHGGLSFPEAVELLAGRAGIELPKATRDPQVASGINRIYEAMEAATALFEGDLWNRQSGAKARRYLEERGLTEETARAARLGYAMAGFDHLRNRLGSTYHLNILVQAGLLVDRDGGRPYDRFRDRLIFPITSSSGRPVAFGARSLDGSEPKYLNSPETPVYKKRDVLYGLATARRAIMDAQATWVVEGYMDVLALRQAGIGHVVAVSGTALSEAQARLLARHAQKVVLFFDGDAAGQKAVVRSLPALLAVGVRVRVALLPQGDDPDSLVRSGGREAIDRLARSGSNVVDFIVSLCLDEYRAEAAASPHAGGAELRSLHGDGRAQALKQLVELASFIPDRMARRLMVEETARQLDFDEATLAREVDGHRRSQRPQSRAQTAGSPEPVAPSPPKPRRPADERWELLLSLALNDNQVLGRLRDELAADDVPDGPYRRLYQHMLDRLDAQGMVVAADMGDAVDDAEDQALLSSLALSPVPDDHARAASELIESLAAESRRREVETLKQAIRRHEHAGDDAEVRRLMARVQELLSGAAR